MQVKENLEIYFILIYNITMKKTNKDKKSEALLIRLTPQEKKGFQLSADIAGISLSSWIRERLRLAAIRELEQAHKKIPFIPEIPLGGKNV